MEIVGLRRLWSALGAYMIISAMNMHWQLGYWDIHVSPPHNYRQWNMKKVALCHAPNMTLMFPYLALFGNIAIYLGLQTLCLVLAAVAMRFPAPWHRYTAIAGAERDWPVVSGDDSR